MQVPPRSRFSIEELDGPQEGADQSVHPSVQPYVEEPGDQGECFPRKLCEQPEQLCVCARVRRRNSSGVELHSSRIMLSRYLRRLPCTVPLAAAVPLWLSDCVSVRVLCN